MVFWLQEKVDAGQSVVDLSGLQPATDYSVTLYALYDEDASDPVTAVATTRKLAEAAASVGLGPRRDVLTFHHK